MSPTQPMTPHRHTEAEVISVEPAMASSLVRLTLTPSDVACSSPNARTFSRQRSTISVPPPTARMAAISITFVAFPERAKLPMSQYVMAGKTSSGSATYFMSERSACLSDPMTTPDKIMTSSVSPPLRVTAWAIATTMTTAARPNANDIACTISVGRPSRRPSATPTLAALLTPKMSGLTMGLRKMPR